MKAVTKESVIKLLAKWGNNAEDAKKMVDAHFDCAVRCLEGAKARAIAEFCSTVY